MRLQTRVADEWAQGAFDPAWRDSCCSALCGKLNITRYYSELSILTKSIWPQLYVYIATGAPPRGSLRCRYIYGAVYKIWIYWYKSQRQDVHPRCVVQRDIGSTKVGCNSAARTVFSFLALLAISPLNTNNICGPVSTAIVLTDWCILKSMSGANGKTI